MATKASKALQVEAAASENSEKREKVIEFKGHKFTVSLDPMDWGYDTMDALAENKLAAALDGMLGEDNARRFKALKPTLREAVDVLNQISADAGADDAGN